MKEKKGEVFSVAYDNMPVPGCTVSKTVRTGRNDIIYFSLAKNTDISAEIYRYYKFILVLYGKIEVYGGESFLKKLSPGDAFLTPIGIPVGIRTDEGAVYTEFSVRKDDNMNEAVKAGEIFNLAELVPYADGRIVNMDVAHNDNMKFVVMSFDEGTGLSEHAAPGDALVFALDGEAVIGYEGKNFRIKAGENFCFAKGGLHSVKADKKFKMALLLTLD